MKGYIAYGVSAVLGVVGLVLAWSWLIAEAIQQVLPLPTWALWLGLFAADWILDTKSTRYRHCRQHVFAVACAAAAYFVLHWTALAAVAAPLGMWCVGYALLRPLMTPGNGLPSRR